MATPGRSAVAALEERHVERALDVLQRLGDGRLAEIEAARGLENAAAVVDLSDQLDVTQAKLARDPALEAYRGHGARS